MIQKTAYTVDSHVNNLKENDLRYISMCFIHDNFHLGQNIIDTSLEKRKQNFDPPTPSRSHCTKPSSDHTQSKILDLDENYPIL